MGGRGYPSAPGPPGHAPDDSDEGGEHDRVVARVDPGERGQVGGDGPGSHARRRLGPGVDDREAGLEGERGQQRPHVGVAGVGHRQGDAPHPSGGGDGLLGHHPPSRSDRLAHAAQHHRRLHHVHQEKPAERQVHRLGQSQVLARLGDGEDLAERRRRGRRLVTGAGVAVHGVDASVVAHDLRQRHRHVPAPGAHVDAAPPGADAQPLERGGQRPPVDVVAQGVGHRARRYRL